MALWRAISRILRERRIQVAIVCLALMVAAIGWHRMADTSGVAGNGLPPGAAPRSDYALSGFRLTLMDELGSPYVLLNGAGMRHDAENERSVFEQPDARILRPGTLWLASARRGWVRDDGDLIRLESDVRLRREAPSLPALELETESLLVHPERETATTDAEVHVRQPGAELSGRGLRVDLATGHYRLDAQVKGRYEMPEPADEPR